MNDANGRGGEGRRVRYTVVSPSSTAWPDDFDPKAESGFDPSSGAHGGNVACPFCGTVADNDYVKAEGKAGRIGRKAMAAVFTRNRESEIRNRKPERGKVYLSADDLPDFVLPDDEAIQRRLEKLCQETGLTVPTEPIEANPRSFDTQHFGGCPALSAVAQAGMSRAFSAGGRVCADERRPCAVFPCGSATSRPAGARWYDVAPSAQEHLSTLLSWRCTWRREVRIRLMSQKGSSGYCVLEPAAARATPRALLGAPG